MMFNGRVMHTTAHCPTCDTRTTFTGTVRVNGTGSEYSHGIRVKPDGSARVLGMCTCGTPLAHPVLGAHLELRPVCGSCKPQPGNPVAYPQPEPDAYTFRLHTSPGNAMYASDLSEAVHAVALLLADNATAGTMPAEPEQFAALASTIVEAVFPHAAAAALHAAESFFIEHRQEPWMSWGTEASKFARLGVGVRSNPQALKRVTRQAPAARPNRHPLSNVLDPGWFPRETPRPPNSASAPHWRHP